ncbi:MAG: AraC family transcriptional regulator [Christensenellales bacterium]|jgi:AraC family transcriptional regulator of arabinose operon
MDEFLIPALFDGTRSTLPHIVALGENHAQRGYFLRKHVTRRQYMSLYIAKEESENALESGEVPAPLREFFEHLPMQESRMYLFQLTLAGRGFIDYGGKTQLLEAGKCMLIDCAANHYLRTDPDTNSWHILWAYLSGPCIERYYDAFTANNAGQCVAQMADENHVETMIRSMAGIYCSGKADQQNDLFAAAVILDMLAKCVRAAHSHASAEHMPTFVWRAREYLTQNFSEKVTLETLAEMFSINKFYLQKLFTQHFGISPNEYIIATRIQHAKEALCETDLSVGEIAERVGMGNASYFARQFKKREGISPSRYRQLMRSAALSQQDSVICPSSHP